ncbi:MAG: toprim domain-containing protein [Prevotella sp.]|nr:toprim domain-containing protein [Prevotella sp.]
MSIEEIRDMPITDFLHRLGHKPTKRRGCEVWYHAPYRFDRTPSFCVNTDKNCWNDFGAGMGGDIFSLAGLIVNTNDFMAQAKYIGEVTNNPIECSKPPKYEPLPVEPQFTDVEVMPLSHPALLGYLRERGIPADIASANCVEIHYRLHDKRYFALGFPNESGGYEIRNKFFKGSIPPKAVSLIRNGSTTVNVYEGFMDFLSGLTLGYGRNEDSLVLNSVANREKAYRHLDQYDAIKCWFDNDQAGRLCLQALYRRYGDKVRDFSVVFQPCKDVNEYLQQQISNNKQQTIKTTLKV